MSKPKVVSSPELMIGEEELFVRESDALYVCLDVLGKYVELPESETYWVEASLQQWPDQSGSRVLVKRGKAWAEWYDEEDEYWRLLHFGVVAELKQLGVPVCKATRIFFRLVYEE